MPWEDILHFTPEEFDTPGAPGTGVNMDPEFIRRLERARVIANVPFFITPGGGFRTAEYNAELVERNPNASSRSLHMNGLAADIAIPAGDNQRRGIVVSALIQAGFERLGLAKTFVHVDAGNAEHNRRTPAIWLY